jgi:hypothetical protein
VVVSEEEVEEGDVDVLATRLTQSVMAEGGMDPLHDRRTAHTLPAGFAAFWSPLYIFLGGGRSLFSVAYYRPYRLPVCCRLACTCAQPCHAHMQLVSGG